ncbi:MAG: TauD/TfdA family dioxygenase [Gammaproteobacteria bacterium]|nr:TauD/TfdA family dioxygenase [Gammaproteobacteria bacterium]MBU1489285.1 TauD/TfdA family dioxygenase [Gammaproteobacteria bacterium]MBU2064464.1 TauD/TfdA family dioxygenase [Gammaproteobacteria bacterium]MBU2137279.1 TauD/TfdA family dioxygenase [Gammaproteobacteria bacterium]MBU2217324.1 TauD/TfdA family dioxygenase [Gammaproteobacteria bacterium]
MNQAIDLAPMSLRVEAGLPVRVSPLQAGQTLHEHLPALQQLTQAHLESAGGMLFSGFAGIDVGGFQAFAGSFGHPLLSYEFGSTPRSKVGAGGVYTSTEFPAHRAIPLHNEQAYTNEWPMRIWFYCAQAAEQGGETPIADSREVYRRIDPAIRQRFAEKKLLYVRNYGNGLDLPWQQVFNTEERQQVERYCRERGIQYEWLGDDELRTQQRCQGVAQHPRTGDWVWFNQAHLFHLSSLDAETQEILIDSVGLEGVPRNVYYGDGTPIEASLLDEVRGVLDACAIRFPWQTGDILMLDNMLTAHARDPFKGPRKVVVAMAEGRSGDLL